MSAEPRTIRQRFRQGIVISLAGAAIVYGYFAIREDWTEVGSALAGFSWSWLPLLLALSVGNYALRFVRWELYLRMLDIRVPVGTSLSIFLAGLAMTITPGKVGEFLKSYLLKEAAGVAMARSAPVVFVERVTDLLSLILLAGFGLAFYGSQELEQVLGIDPIGLVVVSSVVCVAIIVVLQSRALTGAAIGVVGRLPVVARLAPKIEELLESSRALLGMRPLILGLGLASAAWFLECAEYYLAFGGFGQEFSLSVGVFGYSLSTVAGVVTPGGIGPTDLGLIEIATFFYPELPGEVATAASFLVRICTLWFAVALGAVALIRFGGAVDVDVEEAREGGEARAGSISDG